MEGERSAAAAMLGLSGFVVLAVSDYAGELEQAIETTADLVGCPECGAVGAVANPEKMLTDPGSCHAGHHRPEFATAPC